MTHRTTSSTPMDIRRLTPSDAVAYRTLRLAGLDETPSAFAASAEEERAIPFETFEKRLALMPDRGTFGAFDGTRLVGIVTLGRETKPKLLHKAHIWGLYVHRDARGNGIARQLLTHALDLARTVADIRQVNVSVNATNDAAIRLYESAGFVAFGREPASLHVDGVLHDELHMSLGIARAWQRSSHE